jgi:excisionase family DNA binding protein
VKVSEGSKVAVQQTRAAARSEQIAGMRKVGLTYAKIGLRLGISGERVRQILKGVVKKEPQTPRTDPPLRTSEVAHLLNVHVNTVRRWSKKGILEAYPIGPRGDRRFKREDINNLFTKRRSG